MSAFANSIEEHAGVHTPAENVDGIVRATHPALAKTYMSGEFSTASFKVVVSKVDSR